MHVTDAAMAIDADIRVTQIVYPLLNPYNLQLTIAQDLVYDLQTVQIKAIADNTRTTNQLSLTSAQQARLNSNKLTQLRQYMFDSDGKINMDVFAAGSIDTLYLNVGAVAENFALSGVMFKLNVGGNPNAFSASACTLNHNVLSVSGIGSAWAIPAQNITLQTSATAYYMYARCSQTELVGTWQISAEQKTVDNETGYYWFLIGVIYPEQDDVRDADFLYGVATITGNRITVGRITSIDGDNYFDLTSGEFVALNATIKGVITATGGNIGGFEIYADNHNSYLVSPDKSAGIAGTVDMSGFQNNVPIVFFAGASVVNNTPVIDDDSKQAFWVKRNGEVLAQAITIGGAPITDSQGNAINGVQLHSNSGQISIVGIGGSVVIDNVFISHGQYLFKVVLSGLPLLDGTSNGNGRYPNGTLYRDSNNFLKIMNL